MQAETAHRKVTWRGSAGSVTAGANRRRLAINRRPTSAGWRAR